MKLRWIGALVAVWALVGTARAEFLLDSKSSADQVLDALDARGQNLRDFTADVSMAEQDALTGETTTNSGKVWYQSKGNGDARMRVVFDVRKVGDRVDKNARKEYILDNGVLVELDYKTKLRVDRDVLRPGEKLNLLKLGEGPFPLPVGQPKGEVHKMFDVKRIGAGKDDPADTTHIELVPKPGTRFARKFKKLDVWVENKTNFPRRIVTEDKNGLTIRITDLTNIQVNPGVSDRDFQPPSTEGWTVHTESLGE